MIYLQLGSVSRNTIWSLLFISLYHVILLPVFCKKEVVHKSRTSIFKGEEEEEEQKEEKNKK